MMNTQKTTKTRKNVCVTVSPWLRDWITAQKNAELVVSRIVERALVNFYNLTPPNTGKIKKEIGFRHRNSPSIKCLNTEKKSKK